VTELALDDDERHAFARHLDRVRVAKLVRREPPTNPGVGRDPRELRTHSGRRQMTAARRAIDHAQQRPHGQLASELEPGLQLLPRPGVHAHFATAPALAATNQHRAPAGIKIALGKPQRFVDP